MNFSPLRSGDGTDGRNVAFIIGGAGSIGAATARPMVAEGARVVVSDMAPLDELVESLGSELAAGVVADVTDSGAIRSAVAVAVDRFGDLDVAFANAGVFGAVAPVVDYPEDVFEHVPAVNVRGPFDVAKHALSVMCDGGSLILNSSVVGLTSDAVHSGLRDVQARAGGPDADRREGGRAAWHPRQHDPSRALRRHATPEEVAALVLFPASVESRFVTGAALPVDGGMSA